MSITLHSTDTNLQLLRDLLNPFALLPRCFNFLFYAGLYTRSAESFSLIACSIQTSF